MYCLGLFYYPRHKNLRFLRFSISPEEEFAAERTIKSFPHSASEHIFRGGFKHEVLKVSAEGKNGTKIANASHHER